MTRVDVRADRLDVQPGGAARRRAHAASSSWRLRLAAVAMGEAEADRDVDAHLLQPARVGELQRPRGGRDRGRRVERDRLDPHAGAQWARASSPASAVARAAAIADRAAARASAQPIQRPHAAASTLQRAPVRARSPSAARPVASASSAAAQRLLHPAREVRGAREAQQQLETLVRGSRSAPKRSARSSCTPPRAARRRARRPPPRARRSGSPRRPAPPAPRGAPAAQVRRARVRGEGGDDRGVQRGAAWRGDRRSRPPAG